MMLKEIFKRIAAFLKRFYIDPASRRYIKHNELVFGDYLNRRQGDQPIFLMELNPSASAHIAYSYLAYIMAFRMNAKIVCYHQRPAASGIGGLIQNFESVFGSCLVRIFRSFGARSVLNIRLSADQERKADLLFDSLLPELNSKSDVVNLTIDDVWIGDLIYDTYLRRFSRPTLIVSDQTFHESLKESLRQYIFWVDYFDSNTVCGINVSHCVYDLAIPLRIGLDRGVPGYQVNVTHIYKLTKQRPFAYSDFFQFKEMFNRLPTATRLEGLAIAKDRLNQRFSGAVGVDMVYSTKSAFGQNKGHMAIRPSDKTKVLIAAHCFFDAPHAYGENLFPDFFEWLEFLGEMSGNTDYDWYIKTHPDYIGDTLALVSKFAEKYDRFTLLEPDTSHKQIIQEGIDVALTCYGTIGLEYAALGVPVINASVNNPHIAYDFNIHPRTIAEYAEVLSNLENLESEIHIDDVYEYYYMKYIYNNVNIFFSDYQGTIEKIGGYRNQFTSVIYDHWMAELSIDKHKKLIQEFASFVDGEAVRFTPYLNG